MDGSLQPVSPLSAATLALDMLTVAAAMALIATTIVFVRRYFDMNYPYCPQEAVRSSELQKVKTLVVLVIALMRPGT